MKRVLKYVIDEGDCIVEIRGPWDEFAQQNDSCSLSQDSVIGQRIWQFIEGDTREIYRHLVQGIREHRRDLQFQLRCDSPDWRRVIQFKMSWAGESHIAFESAMILEQERDAAKYFRLFNLNPCGRPLFLCSFCNQVKMGTEFWELEEIVAKGFLDQDVAYTKYNCVCPGCRHNLTS